MSDALYLLAGLAILLAALLPSALSRFALSPPIVLLGAGMAIGLLPMGVPICSTRSTTARWSSR